MTTRKVTPLSPKRSKGRPSRTQQLIITLERKIHQSREKIIDLQPDAIDVIHELMINKDAPPQVRLSSAKEILGYGAALYEQLVEMDTDNNIEEDNTQETDSPEENKDLSSVIDWGEFGNLKQS